MKYCKHMETDKIPQELPMAQAHLENESVHKSFLNQRGNFLLILGAVVTILVVIGAGGYLLTMNKNSNPNQYSPQATSTSTQPISSNETANWKTYTNKQYGFTFKHPNLSLEGSICGQKPVANSDIEILSLTSISVDTPNSCDSFNYYLVFHINSKDETIDQEIQAIKDSLDFKDRDVVITEETLGNYKVKKMSLITDLPTEPKTQARNFWFVKNNEYYFFYDPKIKSVYTIYAHFEDPKYKSDIEKIISTIAFDSSLTNIAIKTPFYQYFPKEAFTRPDYTKRNYDKTAQSSYTSKDFYSPLDKISDGNLADFKCSYDIYQDPKNASYHYNIIGKDNTSKSYEIPIGAQLYRVLNNDPRIGFRGFEYCLTSENKEYILATYSGGPLELIQLNGDKVDIKAKDPQITGWYSSCSDIIAITKDNNFYIRCGGGDTTTYSSISKVDANTGNIKKIIECVAPAEGETKCTSF
ncbi:MAG: hypothetical protein UU73_C0001G0342 [Candidatus Daviesbacteria bacterium GW2011_GWA1_41_61]|nr:MAG: hypothetical protein UU44_C0004G0343 [Candidatus Daviesbacteria bacterium GW2011_GWB1_41_15]KKS15705.1 MAG: hypothetical protein UU73_C0001G0342 [Candidatus Daviesbacteria bacterium GW2011_GWA1_41_61]